MEPKQCFVAIFLIAISGCLDRQNATIPTQPWDGKLSKRVPMPVRPALEDSEEFELISLDARYRDVDARKEFLRRKVIGTVPITDKPTQSKILAALNDGVSAENIAVPSCFNPRHGIRVRYKGKSYYLTICFECKQVFTFVDGVNDLDQRFYLAASPEGVFDQILKDSGIPIAPKDTTLEEM